MPSLPYFNFLQNETDTISQIYSHISLFKGAEGGKWLEEFKQKLQTVKTEPKALSSRPNSRSNSRASSRPRSENGATVTTGRGNGDRGSTPADSEGANEREKKRQRVG